MPKIALNNNKLYLHSNPKITSLRKFQTIAFGA